MRPILVTGANKGIGLAIVRGALRDHDDTFVFLGSRDPERGNAAAAELATEEPTWSDRLSVVELDVSRDDSVERAARNVSDQLGASSLYGVVNNAGIGRSAGGMADVLDVNTRGVRRVCEAFVPKLEPGGRVVNVTSASGPVFVSECSEPWQRFFLDPGTDFAALEQLMQRCVEMEGDESAFAREGLDGGDAYGLSKACANTYTLQLAKRHPELRINACTPGFIATDMTRPRAEAKGKSPAEMGMKTPDEGARTPLFLLFDDAVATGHYYGSDQKRSPLDRYRAPGSPEHTGGN
jgi:NAD(P)-dependent dehydrogenase (short-subunit alcohol dehydrogenase family)